MSAVNLTHYQAEQENLRRLQGDGACRLALTTYPTPADINALPAPLRAYIHDLETRCDPAGEVQELGLARETIRGLEARLAELEPSREMTLAEAVAVLNREGHRRYDKWWASIDREACGRYNEDPFTEFEAIAIAREYERKRQG